ncbi:MAG TPA: Spy/CpxP family protein refolding chaperone [Bryobacteraceae bacterium]|jgi:Spy/CpxP family protein refolding chaperone
MKTLIKLTACTSVLATALLAQRPFGVLTAGSPPDPATVVANQVARLTTQLSLTAAQQTQATTIFTNAMNAVTPLQSSEATARQALTDAVKTNATSTIDQLSATLGSLMGQILAIQNRADAAFYAILTADQQSKLSQTRFPGEPGFGRGPGFGPPPGR